MQTLTKHKQNISKNGGNKKKKKEVLCIKDMKKFMGWTMTKVQMKFSCEFGINWGTMHEFDPGKKHKDLDFSKFYDEEIKRYIQEPYPHKWKLLK